MSNEEFECDESGCDESISHSKEHACGGQPGSTEYGCDKYFCELHLIYIDDEDCAQFVCPGCYQSAVNTSNA